MERLRRSDPRQRCRACDSGHGSVEEPYGPVALDSDRLEHPGGATSWHPVLVSRLACSSVPVPMDLAFPAGLVLVVVLSVVITGQVAGDGRSDWLKGAQLLAVYLVLAITFFFVPNPAPH